MWTDSGLTDGSEYFYTVKALNGCAEGEASDEDSDIVDPDAIPWDTRDPAAILTACSVLADASAPDEPIDIEEEFRIMGPDGAIYERGVATQQPPSGQFSGEGLFVLNDGDSIVPPNVEDEDEEESSGFQTMDIGGKLRGGPYRGAYTKGGYTESAFDVYLGPVSITGNSVTEDGVSRSISETGYVIMGSRTVDGSSAVDACLGNGNFRRDGKWHPYVQTFPERFKYPDSKRYVRAYYGKNYAFNSNLEVRIHYWVAVNKVSPKTKKVMGYIRFKDTTDAEAPAVAIGFPLSDHQNADRIGMKRAQQLAQNPENFGSRFYHRTGSSMKDFIWQKGRLKDTNDGQLRAWVNNDLKTGLRYGNPCSVPSDVVSAQAIISPSWEQNVNIVLPHP